MQSLFQLGDGHVQFIFATMGQPLRQQCAGLSGKIIGLTIAQQGCVALLNGDVPVLLTEVDLGDAERCITISVNAFNQLELACRLSKGVQSGIKFLTGQTCLCQTEDSFGGLAWLLIGFGLIVGLAETRFGLCEVALCQEPLALNERDLGCLLHSKLALFDGFAGPRQFVCRLFHVAGFNGEACQSSGNMNEPVRAVDYILSCNQFPCLNVAVFRLRDLSLLPVYVTLTKQGTAFCGDIMQAMRDTASLLERAKRALKEATTILNLTQGDGRLRFTDLKWNSLISSLCAFHLRVGVAELTAPQTDLAQQAACVRAAQRVMLVAVNLSGGLRSLQGLIDARAHETHLSQSQVAIGHHQLIFEPASRVEGLCESVTGLFQPFLVEIDASQADQRVDDAKIIVTGSIDL